MKTYNTHKSSLFLIELIIAIAFFSLASAVCLRLFVKSHLLSRETTELNTAVNLATSVAESFRYASGDEHILESLLPELESPSESNCSTPKYYAYYSEDGDNCAKSDAIYTMTMTISHEEQDASALIQIRHSDNDTLLYELPVQIYVPNTFPAADAD